MDARIGFVEIYRQRKLAALVLAAKSPLTAKGIEIFLKDGQTFTEETSGIQRSM